MVHSLPIQSKLPRDSYRLRSLSTTTTPTDIHSDDFLVRRAQQGEMVAFDYLKTRHQLRVVALCNRMLRHPQEGEQAAQDTFLQAWSSINRYTDRGSFVGWLLRIARNVCLNILRTKKGQANQNTPSLDDPSSFPAAACLAGDTDISRDGISRLYGDAIFQALQKRVRTKTPHWDQLDWDIFGLRVGQGEENFAQIARLLGKGVDTVKYRYQAHIQVVLAAIRKDQVITAIRFQRKYLAWTTLDWALFRLVYAQEEGNFVTVAARAGRGGPGATPEALRHRYEARVLPVIAVIEAELCGN